MSSLAANRLRLSSLQKELAQIHELLGKSAFMAAPPMPAPLQGMPPQGAPPQGMPVDPNTGMPVDPNTGMPIDPSTGMPFDPNASAAPPASPSPEDIGMILDTLEQAAGKIAEQQKRIEALEQAAEDNAEQLNDLSNRFAALAQQLGAGQ